MSIFRLFELLVFIAVKRPFFLYNIVKHIFLVYMPKKKKIEKWPIFDQNHELTPLEKSRFLDFLNFLFLKSRKAFFPSRISWKYLLLELGVLGIGIRNTSLGMRNPTKDWNPESKFYWQWSGIQCRNLESTAWSSESKTVLDDDDDGLLMVKLMVIAIMIDIISIHVYWVHDKGSLNPSITYLGMLLILKCSSYLAWTSEPQNSKDKRSVLYVSSFSLRPGNGGEGDVWRNPSISLRPLLKRSPKFQRIILSSSPTSGYNVIDTMK